MADSSFVIVTITAQEIKNTQDSQNAEGESFRGKVLTNEEAWKEYIRGIAFEGRRW